MSGNVKTKEKYSVVFEKGMFKGRVQERDVIENLLRKVLDKAEPQHQAGMLLAIMAVNRHAKIKETK